MALKLDIINTALRMVGSYHLDRLDDGSSTYEITSAAFDQAFLEVFGDNIFGYNKKRSKLTGTEILNDDDFSFSFTIPSDLNDCILRIHPHRFGNFASVPKQANMPTYGAEHCSGVVGL